MASVLLQWEAERTTRRQRCLEAWAAVRLPVCTTLALAAGIALGGYAAAGPDTAPATAELHDQLAETEVALQATEGELKLARLELERLHTVMDYSKEYDIPADISAAIYDVALAEGLDPDLAYRLVWVESRFYPRAVSHAGAVGLAQLMPNTAFGLNPELSYGDLFEPKTNLHLGFRYLRLMLQKYDGDLRLALLAYNRGPGTVDRVRRQGKDPANGYARAVMRGP